MNKSQHFWLKASRLLSEPKFFDSERERILSDYPLLSSHGLGQVRQRRRFSGSWKIERVPEDLEAARDELRSGGQHEKGIRNTLEYFVKGKVPLSYRLRGCGWARPINGPAPERHSSYFLKHQVESYSREYGEHRWAERSDGYTSNGAFICASLMAGLRIWTHRDSLNPDLRLGKPWAIAGLQPEDYEHPEDERMAKFWRWAVQQDISHPYVEDFISDTVDLLYSGAHLQKMQENLKSACSEAREVYYRLRREFGFREEEDRYFGSAEMQEEDVDEGLPSIIGINKYRDIAKEQLETALRLYFEQRDFYSVITLAGAAEEILGKMLNHTGEKNLLESLVTAALELSKLDGQEVTAREIRDYANYARNRAKHFGIDMEDFDERAEVKDLLNRAISNYNSLTGDCTESMSKFDQMHVKNNAHIRA